MSAENPKPQQKFADKGEEVRAQHLWSGEVFKGNWGMEERRFPHGMHIRSVNEAVNDFIKSGKFQTVRTIPAYDVHGELIPDSMGIVIKPKPEEPTP